MPQKLLPGSQDTQEQWNRGMIDLSNEQYEALVESNKRYCQSNPDGKNGNAAKTEFRNCLDFAAYQQAHHGMYLGLIPTKPRPLYLARTYGNDSTNVAGIYDQATYWKRK